MRTADQIIKDAKARAEVMKTSVAEQLALEVAQNEWAHENAMKEIQRLRGFEMPRKARVWRVT